MHHTKGLASDKSNQKLLVFLFDVFAVRFSLTVTMQALEVQEECKAAEKSQEGKASSRKYPRARDVEWPEASEGMSWGQRVCVCVCVCAHLCTEREGLHRLHRAAPNIIFEGRNVIRGLCFPLGEKHVVG